MRDLLSSASPSAIDTAFFNLWGVRERQFALFLKPEECRAFGDSWSDLETLIQTAEVRWEDETGRTLLSWNETVGAINERVG